MLQKIYYFVFGYLLISIAGDKQQRFINLCSSHNIVLTNISRDGDLTNAIITVKDYRKIKPLLYKTKSRVHIKKRYGLPFFIHKNRKRKTFVFGFVLAWLLIYLSTLFLWDINVSGTDYYSDNQIISFLKENYISAGTLKKNVNCFEIEKILRKEYSHVGWISCDINGTQFNVNITETVDTDKLSKNTEPCDLVAIKDCIINEIVMRNGTPLIQKGDTVKKGDILVSGIVKIMGDFDVMLDVTYVPADADIYGVSTIPYLDEFDMRNYKKEYSNKEKSTFELIVMDNSFKLPFPNPQYDNFDVTSEEKKLRLGRTFYLPVALKVHKYREYKVLPGMLTEEEANQIANKRLTKYLNELEEKRVEILENNVKIINNGTKCIAKGTIKVSELIAIDNPIDESQLNTEGELK